MKARNIIIIIVVNYVLLLVVSSFIELGVIASKARELQVMIRLAGDMALEQTQVVDEYMGYGGEGTYRIKMPSSNGEGFIESDLYGGVFGLDSTIESNKDQIFNRMYVNDDFRNFTLGLGAMKRPVVYWNLARTGFDYYYLPQVAMMGTDILPVNATISEVRNRFRHGVSAGLAQEMIRAYGLEQSKRVSADKEYYTTPLNIGITYLNREMLGTLFMNNLDLLMRSKYDSNLRTEKGGFGILKGETYADRVTDDLQHMNPVNNGSFTILRGARNHSITSVETYRGISPDIEYKVIDMYDPDNEDLLVMLFGANRDGHSSKAEYLRELDRDVINPVTNMPYDSKPIVVAKVTFYVDVIIPYFSVVIRELRSSVGSGGSNYIEIVDDSPEGLEGTRRIAYTTYFAVTP